MFEQINDPIEVIASIGEGKITPRKFLWRGREFLVTAVNLSWSVWEGRSKLYYFAVSSDANYFKLEFNSNKLVWVLLESQTD